MAMYYVNMEAQDNGDHEVHTSTCSRLPDPENRKYLGSFTKCEDALKEARRHYTQVDGCYHCSLDCHRG